MDHRTCTVEDLPPLTLTPVRDLDVQAAPAAGGRHALAAASGVVRRGDHVYVIGDDELHLGVFRLSDPGPGRLQRVLSGELPADAEQRKAAKPDLEALTLLPPFAGHAFGALLGIGSGSGPGRDRGFTWALAADGSLRGEPSELDLAPLYGRLRAEVPDLNVEGVCVIGNRVWLLHRRAPGQVTNVVAELPLGDVMASLNGDRRLDSGELAALRRYDLGRLDGVQLTFSDATPVADEVLVFTASAEAEATAGEDAAIRGSVIGTIGPDGDVRRLRTIDRRYKVEGVHASIDTGVMDLLLVCDQDDPTRPSPLLSAAMPVDGRFEREDDLTAPEAPRPAGCGGCRRTRPPGRTGP